MSARDMIAKLTLRLEDQLSAGLQRLTRLLQQFDGLSRRLGLSGLEGAGGTVDRLGSRVGALNAGLAQTASLADRAAAALRRAGQAPMLALPGPGALLALAGPLAAGALAGSLAGGAPRTPPPGAPFLPPGAGPLRLAGPGGAGGGIPLPPISPGAGAGGGIPLPPISPGAGARSGASPRSGGGFNGGDAALLGAAAGAALIAPLREAARFDALLRDIAITGGATGAEVERQIGRMRTQYEQLALATGQSSEGIAEAAKVLVAAGLQPELIEQLLPTIARVGTAADASLKDLANTAFQLNHTLGITPEELERSFAVLLTAGKAGQFELNDMARFFPLLTAQAKGLGLVGQEAVSSLAAMLQIARTGAGTSSEAANNLANFLQKITSEETVKNFKKAGIDIEQVLRDCFITVEPDA